MLGLNPLKAALREGRCIHGLINSLPLPLMVEMIGRAGYDFAILDLEHVGVNPQTLEDAIRAAEGCGLAALVRVPDLAPARIGRVLDAGAVGVVAPRVSNAEQARALVAASRYHPLGQRGITGGRITGFGRLTLAEHFELANREVMVVAMIEDREGVDQAEAIAAVPGIDLVLEGAVDLSQSLGRPGDVLHAEVQAAVHRIAAACRDAGKPFCAVPRREGQYAAWRAAGVPAFLLGDDRAVAFRALRAHRDGYRAEAPALAQNNRRSATGGGLYW